MEFSNFTWDIAKKIYLIRLSRDVKRTSDILTQIWSLYAGKKEREVRSRGEKAKGGRREVTGEERDTNLPHLL